MPSGARSRCVWRLRSGPPARGESTARGAALPREDARERGRAYALHLTPEGLAVMDRVLRDHDAGVHTVLGALTDGELQQLGALLRKIDQALD